MALVAGEYCPQVEQQCLQWLDPPSFPFARCQTYRAPSRCLGPRVELRFCIDRFEHTRKNEPLPLGGQSLRSANQICQSLGKRLCREPEWTFACEGEQMLPYPYGYTRQPLCNQDRTDLLVPGKPWQLRDWREPSGARPSCVSPWGVFDLVGNLDEPVLRTDPAASAPFRGALKGGWWLPGRNRCRPATMGHDDAYRGFQVGVRCCAFTDDAASAAGARPSR
jgi:formylglycine-generating enzyme required for sulfatase activity